MPMNNPYDHAFVNPYDQFGHAQGMAGQVMGAMQNENNSRAIQAQQALARQHEMAMQQQQMEHQQKLQAMQQQGGAPNNSRYNYVQRQESVPLHASQGGIIEAELAAKGQVGAAQAAALGQAQSARYNADGQAQAGRYSAYGNVANAIANERSSAYGAAAMAEAARQASAGNIGSAALGAAGSAAGSALGAWAQNQNSYNQALAMMSNGGIGGMAAMSIGGGGGPGSGGSFWATGPGGPVANGSYGPGGSGGGGGGGYGGNVEGFARENLDRLDKQHYSSRGMPSEMLDQSFAGFKGLADDGYNQLSSGMNQFYGFAQDPANKGDYSEVFSGLAGGGSGGAGSGGRGGSLSIGGMFGGSGVNFDKVSPYVDALGMGKPQSQWVAKEQALNDRAKYQDTRRKLMAGGYSV